ncbi:ROK family protein [Kribbella sp. NPDC005582]|uniref:ROK family protein n=1 Tax=Kribbella sp. NPDC005582 TaxID=3156893 RepID=UPI0033B96293
MSELPDFLRARWGRQAGPLVAVEVGGSSVQTATLVDGSVVFADGAVRPEMPYRYGLAAPGWVVEGRVRGAHHLGWMDVEAWDVLGFPRRPDVSLNDAEAGALGEWLLREGAPAELLYVVIGTGVGAVRVSAGELVAVEFGHQVGFGTGVCGGCGRQGCLDAAIGGHALPTPLGVEDVARVRESLMRAIQLTGLPAGATVVFAGGVVRSHPEVVPAIRGMEKSLAPPEAKSAAYLGVLDLLQRTS